MKSNFSIPGFLMLLLTLACIALIIKGLQAVLKRTGWEETRRKRIFTISTVAILLWAVLLSVLSFQDFFSDFSSLPPKPALAILIPLPIVLLIAFSKKGTQLLQSIPPHWLIWMQSFRIMVELLLLLAFLNNKLPVQMTFEGRNFDILTGLLALPVGYLLARRKSNASKLAIFYNFLGILLLINILVIAVLSMPTSIRYFMNEPANTLVAEFPFILLPGVLVPLAYTLHIFSLRQLFFRRELSQPINLKEKNVIHA
ncbi:MAG: hypothetical protein E6H07_13385 [Bacteroidetes bacterium]|nr:MAG: hypothetical protein E6H07_13385 [Bacteroidota bacterium]